MKNLVISYQNKMTLKDKEHALAKKFFPSYVSNMKHLINSIYKIHPKTSFWMNAKLLSVAGRKKLSDSDIKFYAKGIERKYRVKNSIFCTYTFGSGPAILLLHGWCSNGARWRLYVNQLVNLGYKVFVVDAPGHGNAPGRFLSVSKYARGIQTILKSEPKWHAVLTHSIAGLTAIAAIGNSEAKYHPSKFIMMNTFATVDTMVNKFSRCLGISEEVITGTKEWMSEYPDVALKEFSICKHYKTIKAKGLLIYDTKDRVVPKNESDYIIQNIKPLQTLKTEGLGHNLRSKAIVKAVISFIDSDRHDVIQLKITDREVAAYA